MRVVGSHRETCDYTITCILLIGAIGPRNAEHPKPSQGMRVPVKVSMLVQAIVRSPYPEPMEPELERLSEHHQVEIQSSAVVAKVG